MRRIDLIAKLVAPLFISIIDAASRHVALWVVLGSSLASVVVEYFAIAQVFHAVPELARSSETEQSSCPIPDTVAIQEVPLPQQNPVMAYILTGLEKTSSSWYSYFRSPVLLASLSLCILYLTVLSFNGQMVTYLLASGFTAIWVAVFRLISVVVELGATWAAPFLMSRIGPIRSGLWFITWQFGCAAMAVAIFYTTALTFRNGAVALVGGVIMSRIGLWGFDLNVQFLVQEVRVPIVFLQRQSLFVSCDIGGPLQLPLAVLCFRSCPAELVRDAIIHDHTGLPTAATIPIPCTYQCWSHGCRQHLLHSLCKEETRSLVTQTKMSGRANVYKN